MLPPDGDSPLPTLPRNVAHFFAQAPSSAVATIDLCWPTLKTCVWSDAEEGVLGQWLSDSVHVAVAFKRYGSTHHLGESQCSSLLRLMRW
jgi:hypothetical protein